jgi:signal recognition particle subunit SRP54
MVLEKLGESLKATLRKIAGASHVDETLVNELVKDIQRSLLQSDVQVKLVFSLTQRIRERALKEQAAAGLAKKDQLVHIVYEELTRFLGGEKGELRLGERKPSVIMLIGLFGSGKTTSAGKLAKWLAKRGNRVALVGMDVHRPAAMDQLAQVAKQVGVPAHIDKQSKDPKAIWKRFSDETKGFREYDVLILDTAGRDALSGDLIAELKAVAELTRPDERILVISADIGQAAEVQAKAFHDAAGITGVIITKMDGTARGGGALTACAATGAPVKFIGVGEKLDDLESFNPQGFVGRLLGMGDIEGLLEKAHEAMTQEAAEDLQAKLVRGEFTLIDLYQQMEAMSKMGPLGKVLEMIPGLGSLQMPKEALQVQEGKLRKWRHVMSSMTKAELEDPGVIDTGRLERIAKGSGCSISDVRELIKQYRQAKKLMKLMKGGSPEKLMRKLQQGGLKR